MFLINGNYFHLHVYATSLDVVTTVVNNNTVKHNCATVSDFKIFQQLHAEETYGFQGLIENKQHKL